MRGLVGAVVSEGPTYRLLARLGLRPKLVPMQTQEQMGWGCGGGGVFKGNDSVLGIEDHTEWCGGNAVGRRSSEEWL